MAQIEFSEMLPTDEQTIIIRPKPQRPAPQPRDETEHNDTATSAQLEDHGLPRSDWCLSAHKLAIGIGF